MQQKRRIVRDHFNNGGPSRLVLLLAGAGFIVVAGLVTLMVTDIPAPQNPIEKQLDAKALLGNT